MASESDNIPANSNQAFINHLEDTGFFRQISNLETALKSIVDELQVFSVTSNKRQQESENIAAHILAMESILTAIMKKHPIEETDLAQEINRQAATLAGDKKPNPTVEAIAMDLLRKSKLSG